MARLALSLLLAALAGVARAAPSVPESAFAATASERGSPRLEGRLLLDHDAVRPGEELRAGVLLTMSRHWHVYWRNSGQSGAPPRLRWQIDGAQVGPTEWPFPQVFREADGFITTYGYTGEVLLASPVTFQRGASGEVEVRVDADVLVCQVQCIPGELHLSRPLRVASESLASADYALFEEWSLRVPRPVGSRELELEAMVSQSAIRPGDDFRAALAVHACAGGDAARPTCAAIEPATASAEDAFVPDPTGGIELLVTGARRPPSPGLLLTLKGHAAPDAPREESRLRGALALHSGGRTEYVEVDLPLPRAAAGAAVTPLANPWLEPPPAGEASFAPALPLWQVLLLALLGGLVLNAMPCVLPVLAIKVFGLAELAQHGRAEILRHGIAYSAGVLASMAALAAVVAALRAAGAAVGWGFQFQEPLFVAAIAAVLVVFALSLFGVFEFRLDVGRVAGAGARAEGLRRSFFEGLLAVVLATPCSAPFLGTAVGFAFASSPATIAGIFLAIGFGLALPFLAICAVPSWARLVPRSGPWMVQLRTSLGFALLGTVVWLAWVLGRSAGSDAQAGLLAYLCALAAGLWLFGLVQRSERAGAILGAGVALLALALAGLRTLPLAGPPAPASESAASDELAGQRFSAAGVDAAVARGTPVFVYFTAEWCLTCKVNEHVVFDDERVRAALARSGFEVFKGDWTRRDGAIRDELARFGKAGVPLYLVYGPKAAPRPIVLPELLTVDLFLKALQEAAPNTEAKT
ncbi:MAG TPA: thioredoxin family protein [Myxococcota bacterium]|nr:thioredoxin family protein [Myxococcota bacterium]